MECPVCSEIYDTESIDSHVNAHFDITQEKESSNLESRNESENRPLSSNIHMDNEKTVTKDVVSSLSKADGLLCKLEGDYLLSCDCWHFASGAGDYGYACGFRNIQMILSSMLQYDEYLRVVFSGKAIMPSIHHIQTLIEAAWSKGFDPIGARQLNSKLTGTRKWIGATEVAMFFRSLKVKATIVDFPHPTGPGKQHLKLLQWVYDYFSTANDYCPRFPLYFQHDGHSRTIVGVQFVKENNSPLGLIILDPSCRKQQMLNLTGKGHAPPKVLSKISLLKEDLRHDQYQIVQLGEILYLDKDLEDSKVPESFHIRIS